MYSSVMSLKAQRTSWGSTAWKTDIYLLTLLNEKINNVFKELAEMDEVAFYKSLFTGIVSIIVQYTLWLR